MKQMIPGFLEEMLKKQYGEEVFAKILAGYQARRPVTLRVNPLKADRNTVEQTLTGAGIAFKNVSWYEDAMIIEGAREPEIQELPIYKEGGIYLQSLSSMLPPLFLGPQAGESTRISSSGRERPRYGCRPGRKDDPDGGDDGKSGADHGL